MAYRLGIPSRRFTDRTTAAGERNTITTEISGPSTRRHSGKVRHVRGSFHAQGLERNTDANVAVSSGTSAEQVSEYSQPGDSQGGKSHDRPKAARMRSLQATRA